MNDLKINIPSTPVMPGVPGQVPPAVAPTIPSAIMPEPAATPTTPIVAPGTPGIPIPSAAAPAAVTPAVPIAMPELDLDALLSKIQETKPVAVGTRKSSALVTNTAEGIKNLVEKATVAGVDRLPWSTVIRQTAIALGVVDKKSQYYYTLGQSVLKVLENTIKTYKEGRKTFIVCAGEIPVTADEETDPVAAMPEAPEEVSIPVQA